jgi:hypothetical protein
MVVGNRLAHMDRRSETGTSGPSRRRCRRNWDGVRVTHALDHAEMTLCWGGGKSLQEHGSKGCVRIPLGWGCDNVVYLFGVPVVELRYNMVEFSSLKGDAGQSKLSFGL